MAVDDELKKRIHREIEKATVKIFVYDEFQGTGFFITPDGYLLTAYHCLLTQSQVVIETNSGKRYDATVDEDKSVKDEDNDGIAVLKADCNPTRYLPLGILSEYDHAHVSDEVVALGYPAEHRSENHQIGTYFGKISRFRKDNKIEIPDAIRGAGQSGGPIYHYKTKKVIGLVLEGYKKGIIRNTGLAMDFKELFALWDDNFKSMTNEVAKSWDERLAIFVPKEKKTAKAQPVTKQIVNNKGAEIGTQNHFAGDINSLNMTFGSNKN
ncbi:MAG: trypsin-like peptidase domain-containing protein [Thiomargarita sp.]|nr:trypsin-like peptidase domain-containing protein [Thiomargarita sp.]